MQIEKEYKFYAAHRNEEIPGKCCNLHGHRYGIRCVFEVERTGSYSTLFEHFDRQIEPFLKRVYDHGLLIHAGDTLYQTLQEHMTRTGEDLKLIELNGPTSVENLAFRLFSEITQMGFRLIRLEVRETDSSVLIYTREDWQVDNRSARQHRGRVPMPVLPEEAHH